MKIETILDAMVKATQEYGKKSFNVKYLARKLRQVIAFRARIIRMFAEKDEEIDRCEMDIELLEAELVTIDAR